MDVLSEVLRVVKLEGVLFFHGEFSEPWCVTTRPRTLAQYLSPDAGQVIVYHFLTEGHAFAELPDGRRVEVAAVRSRSLSAGSWRASDISATCFFPACHRY